MTNSGVVIVDKPADWTSHDVVARVRRLAGTRRVGHAGTLDPMATGVLVLGIDKGTKLLGHLTLTEKQYRATIRLGQRTSTDDAEGEPGERVAADRVTDGEVCDGAAALTGVISQVPPQVSAIKVNGQRAYKMARAGTEVELKARQVTVSEFTVEDIRRTADEAGVLVDFDATVTCSSGTYIRALARDLGAALGVGGHLTALRRTRVGPYDLSRARTLEQLAEEFSVLPLAEAVATAFPSRTLSDEEARRIAHGNRIPAAGLGPGPIGLFAPDGTVLALAEERPGYSKPIVVFAAA
ncbi:tRNA pseudouridine(55) synthase TruB [Marinitenerispora sediminis]|uniref:tRNA pseudouridine synthase B n=1 Tax=Marinitenerispora sediminis TaxID=1931232 RepID=A0A368T5B1_9ACTN|nr:tRNA pseudouridine(55) synthase TruB [Marinitenerispora sediminis]RCV53083.1 tRNA pseudouridine(55) synthase TruB [Marinitenerispora sediminis]RCV58537.1 tRNA pseudouridine(55) synthase TruB [Marinitenerispora sediminis]RCV58660.1 tRNA pseudouridine(55) synthase TruB [Marinitenerispora sediminis]